MYLRRVTCAMGTQGPSPKGYCEDEVAQYLVSGSMLSICYLFSFSLPRENLSQATLVTLATTPCWPPTCQLPGILRKATEVTDL